MKRSAVVFITLLVISALITLVPEAEAGESRTEDDALALQLYSVPNTTGVIEFEFLSFEHNATLDEPYCISRHIQYLAPDKNKTITADATTGALSNTYALDNVSYRIDAYNDSTIFRAEAEFNITLNAHAIADESWVNSITVTVYGNTSITPNSNARVYIYNFSGNTWTQIGLLNSTTQTSVSASFSSPTAFIDEANNNSILLLLNFTDTTNTDFLVDIDYVEVKVDYSIRANVSTWVYAQHRVLSPATPADGADVQYWMNLTLTLPAEFENCTFKLYIEPYDMNLQTEYSLFVNNSQVSVTRNTNYESEPLRLGLSQNVGLLFTCKDIVVANLKSDGYGHTYLYLSNLAQNLTVENLIAEIADENNTITPEVDLHHEALNVTLLVDGNESVPAEYEKGRTISVLVESIAPQTNVTVAIYEELPPVFIVKAGDIRVLSANYEEENRRYTCLLSASEGLREVIIYCNGRTPTVVRHNGTELMRVGKSEYLTANESCYYYDPDADLLYIKVRFSSAVLIEVSWKKAVIAPPKKELTPWVYLIIGLLIVLVVAVAIYILTERRFSPSI